MLLAAAPALPLHSAGKYVAAAYIAFVALLLIYVAIMVARLDHTQRELTDFEQQFSDGRPNQPVSDEKPDSGAEEPPHLAPTSPQALRVPADRRTPHRDLDNKARP